MVRIRIVFLALSTLRQIPGFIFGRQVLGSLVLFCVALLAGCESERAKWNFAQAMNLREEGRLDEATALAQTAMEQSPDNDQIKLRLAIMLSESGKGELGVALCDEHLARFPNDGKAHSIRTYCLQCLGRFDESLSDYKKQISGHVSKTALELNNLAYFRALAKKDLVKAANEIQKAIQNKEEEYQGMRWYVPLRVRTAICAGLISRQIDRRKEALQYLNAYIVESDTALGELDVLELYRAKRQIQKGVLPSESDDQEQAEQFQLRRAFVRRNLALLLVTRALINEDLQKTECVDIDRRRLVTLGFDFDEVARELPSDFSCLASLETACVFLDTRGFVAGRLNWSFPEKQTGTTGEDAPLVKNLGNYQLALEDLDLAVLAAQFRQRAFNSSLFNSTQINPNIVRQQKNEANRMTAVLLFHRMEVHRRAGNDAAARCDEKSIEKLGFLPGSNLF